MAFPVLFFASFDQASQHAGAASAQLQSHAEIAIRAHELSRVTRSA